MFPATMRIPHLRLLLLVGLLLEGCSWMPFVGGKAEEQVPAVSVFDKHAYLPISEYDFPEYQWNRDAKIAEEMYVKGLVDYFYRQRYDRAVVVFNSALKVYKKDARVYTRLVECHARLGQYEEALRVLAQGTQEIRGFDTVPGISRYRAELEAAYAAVLNPPAQPQRGLFSRILRAPAKLWPF